MFTPKYSIQHQNLFSPSFQFATASGEIVVRSPATMLGYIKNPEATKEMLRSDGAHTGDLGYLDEKGYLQSACDFLIFN